MVILPSWRSHSMAFQSRIQKWSLLSAFNKIFISISWMLYQDYEFDHTLLLILFRYPKSHDYIMNLFLHVRVPKDPRFLIVPSFHHAYQNKGSTPPSFFTSCICSINKYTQSKYPIKKIMSICKSRVIMRLRSWIPKVFKCQLVEGLKWNTNN